MKYDESFFSAGIDRRNTNSVKWDNHQVCPEGTIPMWVADMDFPSEPAIAQAIINRARHESFGYTMEDEEGTKAFCDFWKRRHQMEIKPGQTVMMPCVVTGLRLNVCAFSNPGDKVVLNTPVYGPFYAAVRDTGRQVCECPLIRKEDSSWEMNFAAIENAFKEGAKLMLLCNPHNPLCRVWRKEELEKLLNLAEKYDVKIVSDEIHADFVYKPLEFVPMLSLEKAGERVISMASASKTFNIAGLQQSQAVSFNPDMLQVLKKQLDMYGAVSGNIFAMTATRAAYEHGDAWLDGVLNYLSENRFALKADLEKYVPKARLVPIEATYLAWVDLEAYGMTDDEINRKCHEQGVVFNKGTDFGKEGSRFIRINFGCPRAQLHEAILRLGKAMNEKEM